MIRNPLLEPSPPVSESHLSQCPRVPRHIAIVMDGNGRWAERQGRPRAFGHQAGVQTVRTVIECSLRAGVEVLTLFAFSSENWKRPASEIRALMDLFLRALKREVRELTDNGVGLRFIGDRMRFSPELKEQMANAEALSPRDLKLRLNIAVDYGGRWDILQAAQALAREVASGRLQPEDIDQARFEHHLSLAALPEPDLFIRTGGEARISNFLLWHLAYTELHFTEVLWPDFGEADFAAALADYAARERRFGRTSAQLQAAGVVHA
jgi:undecaprenyl diphosphate synthase